MTLDDRIFYVLLGCFIGYVVAKLHEILRKLDDVTEAKKDQRGSLKASGFGRVAIALVVLFTAVAAFRSQGASNASNKATDQVRDTQHSVVTLQRVQEQDIGCVRDILFQMVNAANERTVFVSAQANANIDLVKSQLKLITKIQDPSLSQGQLEKLFLHYVDKVQTFVDLANKTKDKQIEFPYPKEDDLIRCIQRPLPPLPEDGN